jgi:mono/diheme cytochrome c family protein
MSARRLGRDAIVIAGTLLAAIACGDGTGRAAPGQGSASVREGGRLELGHAPAPAALASMDRDVAPDGAGLPPGRGTVAEGEALYRAQCASCHGAEGQGIAPAYPALVGREPREGFPFAGNPKLVRTIGNYWPHASTLFDYIRRAMPLTAPGSLSDDQVYALTAYLLAANELLPRDAALDSASLMAVRMPARDRFVPDDRRGGREVR